MISFKKAAAGILSIALLAGMFLPVKDRDKKKRRLQPGVYQRCP